MSTADIVTKCIDEILDIYERALRDADSPLTATVDRWQQARGQAEAILCDCARMLGGTVEEQSDPYALTRDLGIQRARQQVLIADSIRAGTLLWRSAVPVLREVLTASGPADCERLPEMLELLHEAISIRLYIGSMAHEHVRLAGHAPDSGGDPRHVSDQSGSETLLPPDDITAREWEVLECVSRALSNHEIAKELDVSEATVKTHLRKAFRKLGATSRVDAINKVGLRSALACGSRALRALVLQRRLLH